MCGYPCSGSRRIGPMWQHFSSGRMFSYTMDREKVCAAIWRQGTLYYITQETARRQMKTNATISPSLALAFSSSFFCVSLLFLSKCNSLPRLLLKFHTRDCHANQNIIICSLLISFCCNVHVFLLSACPATESAGTNSRRVCFSRLTVICLAENKHFSFFFFWT